VKQVKQKILSIDILDIAVVGVSPFRRPRIDEHERVTAIKETGRTFYHDGALDREMMFPSELRSELLLGNVSALPSWACVTLVLCVLLLAGPHLATLPIFWFLLLVGLLALISWGLRLFLAGRLHLVLLGSWSRIFLPLRLFLPLRFCLLRLFLLLLRFFVLSV
jgi:hypothetical protein